MFPQTIGAPNIQLSSVSSSFTPAAVNALARNITSIRQGMLAAAPSSNQPYRESNVMTPMANSNQCQAKKFMPLKNHHLRKWLSMGDEERKKKGTENFASEHNISFKKLIRNINLQGLTVVGHQRLSRHELVPVEIVHLEKWSKMTRKERQRIGVAKFALNMKINLANWRRLVSTHGLKPAGERFLSRKKTTLFHQLHIQAISNNETIAAVAKKSTCFFCINDTEGQLSTIFAPNGHEITQLPPTVAPEQIMWLLLQRENNKLVYDAIRPGEGIRKIAVSPRDENNLYHALIKALHPHSTEEDCQERISAIRLIKQSH
ncbi:hypothetical protein ITX54_00880 [Rouxiella silvae]|uniref:Uncharacterized protein n=1 Tax=Rouxiella silvae TaxID=1646373 RepID=A0AA40WY07_9GAMM|nr:hypothetical protein [Rouxiella silvae]MBF6635225.1 hypothetical protein [Rouxiella silvae]